MPISYITQCYDLKSLKKKAVRLCLELMGKYFS